MLGSTVHRLAALWWERNESSLWPDSRDRGSVESEYTMRTPAGILAASNERLHIGIRVTNHVEEIVLFLVRVLSISLSNQSASEVSKDS